MKKTHWREHDYRIESFKLAIAGLNNSIQYLIKKNKENYWYDASFLQEDAESLYGIAFVACQTYINSSIYDFDDNIDNRILHYKADEMVKEQNGTRIELIVALANCFKHQDDAKPLNKQTLIALNRFDLLKHSDQTGYSPIISGAELLCPNWDLQSLVHAVSKWRNSLWQLNKG